LALAFWDNVGATELLSAYNLEFIPELLKPEEGVLFCFVSLVSVWIHCSCAMNPHYIEYVCSVKLV
jgi:hypothetical protein